MMMMTRRVPDESGRTTRVGAWTGSVSGGGGGGSGGGDVER
jgi:hypothetical protein